MSNISEEDYYHEFFHPRFSLIIISALSVILTPLVIALLYSIIWFERNCSDSKRTLINRLVSAICRTCICFFILPQSIDLFRYIYGPLPHRLCYFNLYIKNVFTIQDMVFTNAILISKYVYIFVLKNPLGFQDEFWYKFVFLWSTVFSYTSQFVLDFIPGKFNYNLQSEIEFFNQKNIFLNKN